MGGGRIIKKIKMKVNFLNHIVYECFQEILFKETKLKNRYIQGNIFFFFSSRRRHTRSLRDRSSDVCSSDLIDASGARRRVGRPLRRRARRTAVAAALEAEKERGERDERDRKSVV